MEKWSVRRLTMGRRRARSRKDVDDEVLVGLVRYESIVWGCAVHRDVFGAVMRCFELRVMWSCDTEEDVWRQCAWLLSQKRRD